MKIGIVTWYWGNYGSILQAYALQQFLINEGFNCEVINHHVNGDFYTQVKYRLSHDGIIVSLNSLKKKIQGKIWSSVDKNNRRIRSIRFDSFIRDYIVLSQKMYSNFNYKYCEDYDAYVCGSDQIWNPSFTFLSPFYWLGFLPEDKIRIAYAPSMGTGELKDSDKRIVKDYLKKFKAISTREKNSGMILEKLDPTIKVEHVSDPTILLDSIFWESKVKANNQKNKYLFAYIIKGDSAQRRKISEIAKNNNLDLLVYPYLENHYVDKDERTWGDYRCFDEDPFDFLSKIYHAEMVITDSFHCSVFSLLFHKDFYVLKKRGDQTNQFNRIEQLLKLCGAENRIFKDEKLFVKDELDYEAVDKAISAIRNDSRDYLLKALQNKSI